MSAERIGITSSDADGAVRGLRGEPRSLLYGVA